MAPRDDLERYEATEAQDLTRLLYALRPPEREVQVSPPVDLTIRAAISQAPVRRQVVALLSMARRDIIRVIRQALTGNPLLEEGEYAGDEPAPAGAAHAPPLTAAADLADAAERYDSIWQACVPDGWDAHGLHAPVNEARDASDPPSGSPEAIVPDVLVTRVGEAYQVVLNDEDIPRLRLRATPRRLGREAQGGEPGATQDLDDHLRAAVWLIRGLEHRRQTLLTVATSLVTWRRDFFDHGAAHLKPLVLTEVAEALGLHASTVRLVIANTYLATAHGMIALTSFFPSGLASAGGEPRSSLTVRETQQLIAAEAGTPPAWPPGVRLSPDEEQWMRQILEASVSLPHRQAWLQSRHVVPDPVGEMRAARRDLRTALAHPPLRPAVLLALRAFAQAAQAGGEVVPPADAMTFP